MMYILQKRQYKVGMLLAKRNQHLDALDQFQQLLKIHPDSLPDILIALYQQLKLKFYNLPLRLLIAEIQLFSHLEEDAVLELAECVALDKSYTNTYHTLSKIFRKQKCQDTIVSLFEEAIENDIFDSSILDILPNVYLEKKEYVKGIRLFVKLVEKFPDNCPFYKTLASLYTTVKEDEKGALLYEKIAARFPEHTEEVTQRCEKLIRYSPDNLVIRRILAKLQVKACNPETAHLHLQVLLDHDPEAIEDIISEYKALIKFAPQNPLLLLGLGKALAQKGEYTDAIYQFIAAIDLDANYCNEVNEMLEAILEKSPKQLLALELLMDIAIVQFNLATAIQRGHDLLTLDMNQVPNLIEKGKLMRQKDPNIQAEVTLLNAAYYLKTESYQECISEAQLLLDSPFKIKARTLQALAFEKLKQARKGKLILLDVLSQDPFNAENHHALERMHHDILSQELENSKSVADKTEGSYFQSGLISLRLGEFMTAIEHFQKITSPSSLQNQAQILIGRSFLELGRFDLASNQFVRALNLLEHAPDNDLKNKINYLLAITYFHLGQYQDAIDALENVYANNVSFPHLAHLLTHLKSKHGQTMHCLSGCFVGDHKFFLLPLDARPSAKKRPTHSSMSFGVQHNLKGLQYLYKQQYNAAQEEFTLALQLDPALLSVHFNLCVLYILQDSTDKASEHLAPLKDNKHYQDLVFLYQGLIEMKKGEAEKAKQNFLDCLALNPEQTLAHLNLGDLYWANNQIKEAFSAWAKANCVGDLFFLINRRLGYLRHESFNFKHWTSDFFIELEGLLPTQDALENNADYQDELDAIDAPLETSKANSLNNLNEINEADADNEDSDTQSWQIEL